MWAVLTFTKRFLHHHPAQKCSTLAREYPSCLHTEASSKGTSHLSPHSAAKQSTENNIQIYICSSIFKCICLLGKTYPFCHAPPRSLVHSCLILCIASLFFKGKRGSFSSYLQAIRVSSAETTPLPPVHPQLSRIPRCSGSSKLVY